MCLSLLWLTLSVQTDSEVQIVHQNIVKSQFPQCNQWQEYINTVRKVHAVFLMISSLKSCWMHCMEHLTMMSLNNIVHLSKYMPLNFRSNLLITSPEHNKGLSSSQGSHWGRHHLLHLHRHTVSSLSHIYLSLSPSELQVHCIQDKNKNCALVHRL